MLNDQEKPKQQKNQTSKPLALLYLYFATASEEKKMIN